MRFIALDEKRRARSPDCGTHAGGSRSARRLLLDRRRSSGIRTGHRMGAGARHHSATCVFPTRHGGLSRHRRRRHGSADRRRAHLRPRARLALADADPRRLADDCADERAHDTDSPAADWPLHSAAAASAARPRKNSGLSPDDGHHPDDPGQRRARAGSGRAHRSACARQPRPEHPFRHSQ